MAKKARTGEKAKKQGASNAGGNAGAKAGGKAGPADKQLIAQPTRADLATIEPIAVTVKDTKVNLTAEIVRKYFIPKGTPQDLFTFMGVCNTMGLNPLEGDAHWVPFKDGGRVVVGYRVYLKVAEASGKLDGWSVVLEGTGPETRATVTIYRKDWTHPFVWQVSRKEADTGSPVWKKMPDHMLKVRAIGQAFRLAFPGLLAGMPYTAEEFDVDSRSMQKPQFTDDQVLEMAETTPAAPGGEVTTLEGHPEEMPHVEHATLDEHCKAWFAALDGMFANDHERHKWQKANVGKESTHDWTAADYKNAFDALDEALGVPPDDAGAPEDIEEAEIEKVAKPDAKKAGKPKAGKPKKAEAEGELFPEEESGEANAKPKDGNKER